MIIIFIVNRLFGGYYGLQKFYTQSNPIIKRVIRLLHKVFQLQTGCYLPLNTKFKGPPNWPHGTFGVFISGDARIGSNCTIFQHVTIGSNMLVDSKGLGAPIIGDNVLIGAGAKIIGKVVIGNNCRIGANCIVTQNVDDNSTVIMGKPIVIQKENNINRIYMKNKSGWEYSQNGKVIVEKSESILRILDSIRKESNDPK